MDFNACLSTTPISEFDLVCCQAKTMSPVLNTWTLHPVFLNSWWRHLHYELRSHSSSLWCITIFLIVSDTLRAPYRSTPDILGDVTKTRSIERLVEWKSRRGRCWCTVRSRTTWGRETREGHPPPPQGGPNLPGVFPETSVAAPVPGRGVPGRAFKLDQAPG